MADALPPLTRYPPLDYLRGGAVMVVMFTHAGWIDLFNIAVDLFFVMSGFLVSKPLIDRLYAQQSPDYARFWRLRLAKILPSYWLFLAVVMMAGRWWRILPAESLPPLCEWDQYLLFYRNYAGPPPREALDHTWSLCVEMQFYALLALTVRLSAWIMPRHQHYTGFVWIWSAIIVLSVAAKLQALFSNIAEWPNYTHNRIDAFGWGIFLCVALNHYPRHTNRSAQALLGAWLLVGLGFLLSLSTDEHWLVLRCVMPLAWAMCLYSILHPSEKLARQFDLLPCVLRTSIEWLQYPARYSYNLYLWHYPLLLLVRTLLEHNAYGSLGICLIYANWLLLTGLLAWLTTEYWEIPCRKKVLHLGA